MTVVYFTDNVPVKPYFPTKVEYAQTLTEFSDCYDHKRMQLPTRILKTNVDDYNLRHQIKHNTKRKLKRISDGN